MAVIPLPLTLVETHNTDSLEINYLYVQGIPFHHSISKSYKFRTIEALRGKKKPNNNDVSSQSKFAINMY